LKEQAGGPPLKAKAPIGIVERSHKNAEKSSRPIGGGGLRGGEAEMKSLHRKKDVGSIDRMENKLPRLTSLVF